VRNPIYRVLKILGKAEKKFRNVFVSTSCPDTWHLRAEKVGVMMVVGNDVTVNGKGQ
jgi:hypothetical protein